jgi:Domain of unknown function (DUF4396)
MLLLTIPPWLEFLSYIYLVSGFASAIYIVYDILIRGHRQSMKIMNVVWPITAWYLCPLALWAYWHIGHLNLINRASKDGKNNNDNSNNIKGNRSSDNWSSSFRHHIIRTHEAENKPFWETIFVSATHCGAGCTLGDVVSEWSVFLFGITIAGISLWPSYIFDFILAWLLGIIFQYLAIVQMRKISLREGLFEAIKADTLSLVTFEIGLFGWMALTTFLLIGKLPPSNPVFWFIMQIGMALGFFTSYPANWWLVRRGIKMGM